MVVILYHTGAQLAIGPFSDEASAKKWRDRWSDDTDWVISLLMTPPPNSVEGVQVG